MNATLQCNAVHATIDPNNYEETEELYLDMTMAVENGVK